ncbi:terpene synthase family protein [Streptomyces sp. NPDC005492]|uniref:terpene synthase family protein n=1 Tax=Streptomyces sp. NPDC005492 TaxID=3156883 RepID=UPI0033B54BF2
MAQLADCLQAGGPPPATELGALYRSLIADLHSQGVGTSRFQADCTDLCAAVSAEANIDPDTVDWEQFHALRRMTIGNAPYITHWRTIRGLDLNPAPGDEPLIDVANQAVYLANDLGSFARERAAGAPVSSDFVLLHARDFGDLDRAVQAGVARYRSLIDELAKATSDLAPSCTRTWTAMSRPPNT